MPTATATSCCGASKIQNAKNTCLLFANKLIGRQQSNLLQAVVGLGPNMMQHTKAKLCILVLGSCSCIAANSHTGKHCCLTYARPCTTHNQLVAQQHQGGPGLSNCGSFFNTAGACRHQKPTYTVASTSQTHTTQHFLFVCEQHCYTLS